MPDSQKRSEREGEISPLPITLPKEREARHRRQLLCPERKCRQRLRRRRKSLMPNQREEELARWSLCAGCSTRRKLAQPRRVTIGLPGWKVQDETSAKMLALEREKAACPKKGAGD